MARILIFLLLFLAPRVLGAEKLKVSIIDTGIRLTPETRKYMCKESFDATGEGIIDFESHGTNVAGLIVKGIPSTKVCLVIVKYYAKINVNDQMYQEALKYVLQNPTEYVNMSLESSVYLPYEYKTLKALTEKGTKITVAAGNNKINFDTQGCKIYPACLKLTDNFYVVGAYDLFKSNFNGPVTYWMPGMYQKGFGIYESGTSQASANYMNFLLKQALGIQ